MQSHGRHCSVANGGVDDKSDAALADNDDDDTFPVAAPMMLPTTMTLLQLQLVDQEAERIANARARYDFSTANLKSTALSYKNDLFRLEDKHEQPLICELASLHREAATHFIDTMMRKPAHL